MYFLFMDLFEKLGEVGLLVQTFGVGEADVRLFNHINEYFQSVNAKIIVAVEESHPAPLEVFDDTNDYLYDVCVWVDCA